jgi:hypothetical protein
LDAWITNIKAAVSGIRIGLLMTIPAGGQNTFGQVYTTQVAWRYARNHAMWIEDMLVRYDKRQAENIYVFPYNAVLDTVWNCQVSPTDIAVNALQPEITFPVSTNGVHPASFGYWQMGQAVWSFLKAQES